MGKVKRTDVDDALDLFIGDTDRRSLRSPEPAQNAVKHAKGKARNGTAARDQAVKQNATAGSLDFDRSGSTPVEKSSRRETLRGRPKGLKAGEGPRREKRSIYIRTDIAAAYDEWTWEAKVNMGRLVETALAEYLQKHGREPR